MTETRTHRAVEMARDAFAPPVDFGRLAGSRADASSPSVSTKGFDPGRIVRAFCLASATFAVVWFGGQLLRSVLP